MEMKIIVSAICVVQVFIGIVVLMNTLEIRRILRYLNILDKLFNEAIKSGQTKRR